VIDARAILEFLDGLIFVALWGGTRRSQVQSILRNDRRLQERSYGMVLNMFDSKKARSYGSRDAAYYGYGYNRYYRSD